MADKEQKSHHEDHENHEEKVVKCEHKNTKFAVLVGYTGYEFCLDCGMSRADDGLVDNQWELNQYGLQQEYLEMAVGVKKIVVDPDEWDEDIIDCPFADQELICLRPAVEGMSTVYCAHCGSGVPSLDKCPLEDGPVTVSLKPLSARHEDCCCYKCELLTADNTSPDCGCEGGPAFHGMEEQQATCVECPKRDFCDVTESPGNYLP